MGRLPNPLESNASFFQKLMQLLKKDQVLSAECEDHVGMMLATCCSLFLSPDLSSMRQLQPHDGVFHLTDGPAGFTEGVAGVVPRRKGRPVQEICRTHIKTILYFIYTVLCSTSKEALVKKGFP